MNTSILVTGATGTIGSLVIERLASQHEGVRALVRTPGKRTFPSNVREVQGDMGDVASMRAALDGVRTLFLLNAVTPDEVTQAILTLNLAQEAGIERVVYLSVIHADLFHNVPHFAGKYLVEQAIRGLGLPATILRPAYFMQNDASIKDVVLQHGVYPMPIGAAGVEMIDTRDIADIAVMELLRRDRAPAPLPLETIELAGPEAHTPDSVTAIWQAATGKTAVYGGDDLDAFERQLGAWSPGWMAYDMRLMMGQIQRRGMHAAARGALAQRLGRPLRTYADAVQDMLAPS